MVKLTKGQAAVLVAASLPMAAAGVAGGVASYFNFASLLASRSNAISLVLAGEGATVICALVALAVTLMGQHTPGPARAGLWLIPLAASVAGVAIAPDLNTRIVMALSPLAMTAAGEGITLVARRIVAYRTGIDIEQQRRSGLLLWHANRAANGSGLGRRISKAAVWRLTKQFAATDSQLSVQLGEIQRYRVGEGADNNLAAVLSGAAVRPSDASAALGAGSERPAVAAAPQLPELPYEAAADQPAPLLNPEVLPALMAGAAEVTADDSWEFISGVLGEAEAHVAADPNLKLLTSAEVATLRGVNPGTVRSWVSRGKLSVADRGPRGEALFSPVDVARMV